MSYYREFTPVEPMDNVRRYNTSFYAPGPQAYDPDQVYLTFDPFTTPTRLDLSTVAQNTMAVHDSTCNHQTDFFPNGMQADIGQSVPSSYTSVQEPQRHVFLQQSTSYYQGSIVPEDVPLYSTPGAYDYSDLLQMPSLQPHNPALPRSSPPQENTSPPPSPVSPTGVTGSESEDSERDRSHPCSYCNKAFARAHDRKSEFQLVRLPEVPNNIKRT